MSVPSSQPGRTRISAGRRHALNLREESTSSTRRCRLCRRACTRSSSWSGTSTDSWEEAAAAAAVEKAASSLRDLRIAEVAELDLQIEGGVVKAYRAKVKVSFKYED